MKARERGHSKPVIAGLLALAAFLAGCTGRQLAATASPPYTIDDFARVAKLDAHVHVNTSDDALLRQAQADGFQLVSINVDYSDFPAVDDQAKVAESFARKAPLQFFYATTFSMRGWGEPGFISRVTAEVEAARAKGAVAVKIWKNVGMTVRDEDGRYVMIDDPRFQPLLARLTAIGMPLIGHQGEPYNAWLPLDQMTTSNDRNYFREHPQYHMYLHPEVPGYEAQMAARDRMLERNPDLIFIGAHVASLEWSVDRLRQFLDRHPNAAVDLAARMAQIQYQSVRAHEKVRDFFIRYQDRILYGSDLTHNPGVDPADIQRDAHQRWLADWRYLATAEPQQVEQIGATVTGLALPRDVIDKIYYRNAQRLLLNRRARS